MPVSPRKNVSSTINSTANRGVQAREIDITNTHLDRDALGLNRTTDCEWPADTFGYRSGNAVVEEVTERKDGAMAAGDGPTPLTPPSTDQSISYVQVVVQKQRRSGTRHPTASSPMRAELTHTALPIASIESGTLPATVLLACPAFAALHQQSWDKPHGLLEAGTRMQAAACDARASAGQNTVKQSEINTERVKQQYFWKKVHSSYKHDANDYDDGPDCVEVYEFDHGYAALVARGAGPLSCVERGVRRASRPAAALLAELLAVPRLVLAAPIHVALQFQRCVLLGVREAATGVVQTTADTLVKPLLALTFNAVLHPPLVCLAQSMQAIREALQPLALALADVMEPFARLLGAIRLVHIDRHCTCAHHV